MSVTPRSFLFLVLLSVRALGLWQLPTELHSSRHFTQTVEFSAQDVQKIVAYLRAVPVALISGQGLATGKDLPPVPKECSLVSNGRGIRASNAGKRIDETRGPVMRFNGAVLGESLQPWVGSRQDFLLVNDFVICAYKRLNTLPPPDVKYLLVNTFGKGWLSMSSCVQYLHNRTQQSLKIFVLDMPRMNMAVMSIFNMLKLGEVGERMWVTSGMAGLLFFMNMCERVNHFGFMNNDTCREHYWEHYWDYKDRGLQCSVSSLHHLKYEKVLWRVASKPMQPHGSGWLAGSPKLQRADDAASLKH